MYLCIIVDFLQRINKIIQHNYDEKAKWRIVTIIKSQIWAKKTELIGWNQSRDDIFILTL